MIDTAVTLASYLVPFIFVLTIVVFFHELGHFWVGRKCGARVEAFSIGFGRAIASWEDKQGTVWKICWLPLGGYVRFKGDENAASTPSAEHLADVPENERSEILHFLPLWRRAATVAAGPCANFILAIFIFAALYTTLGQRVTQPVVDMVVEESAAARAGFQRGDIIRAINGSGVDNFGDVRRLVTVNADTDLRFTLERDGSLLDVIARPDRYIETDRFGNEFAVGRLGVGASNDPAYISHRRYDPFTAIGKGAYETWFIIEQTFVILGKIITGRESADNLGGPIRIAQVSGQTATLGLIALINLTAVL